MIGAVANIHGDCEIRIYAIAGCCGASDTDFFLGGAHGYDFRFEGLFVCRQAAQCLTDNVGPAFVVEGASGANGTMNEFELVIVSGDVSHLYA